jgi:hypothetical protein
MTSNSLQPACKRGLNQNDARFGIGFRNLPDFMSAPELSRRARRRESR